MHVATLIAPTLRSSTCTTNAQPSLTSGFGAILEQERELQSATAEFLGVVSGPGSTEIDRVLRIQQVQLRATVALLEQRYELLPHPRRFEALRGKSVSRTKGRPAVQSGNRPQLAALAEQQRNVLARVLSLIEQRPDSQRGELMLAQVARNHEQMAAALTTLMNEPVFDHDPSLVPILAVACVPTAPAEANWENEGGPSRVTLSPLPQPALT